MSDFQRKVWSASQRGEEQKRPTVMDVRNTDDHLQAVQQDTASKEPLMWLIIALPQEHRGVVLRVRPNAVIGRTGDIVADDPMISRQHARFVLAQNPTNAQEQQFAIMPINDRNGTFINGKRITGVVALHENDRVEMGSTVFVVKVLD